jgi:hypothetical protein
VLLLATGSLRHPRVAVVVQDPGAGLPVAVQPALALGSDEAEKSLRAASLVRGRDRELPRMPGAAPTLVPPALVLGVAVKA